MLKELITKFLDRFAVRVAEDEDDATTELYMDDHDCIEFEDTLYYVPKNNSFYDENDELMQNMLVSTFTV